MAFTYSRAGRWPTIVTLAVLGAVARGFASRWPALQIGVTPQVPAGHTIALHQAASSHTAQATIAAPGAPAAQFYAISDIVCANGGQGFSERPSLTWQPVHGVTLAEPACDGVHPAWTYSVGAPGFAIASGKYPTHG